MISFLTLMNISKMTTNESRKNPEKIQYQFSLFTWRSQGFIL